MVQIIRHTGFKFRFYTPVPVVDGGANKFLGAVEPKGSSADVLIMKQQAGGGPYLVVQTYPYPATRKADHVGLAQSGANLHVFISWHEGDVACGIDEEVLEGACVPYAQGPQLGMPGAYVEEGGGGEPNPTPTFTLEDVLAGMANLLGVGAAPTENNLIGRLRPQIRQNVEQLFRQDGSGSPVVWSQLVNTSYAGALAAITEGGQNFGHTPQEAWAMRDAAEAIGQEPDDYADQVDE